MPPEAAPAGVESPLLDVKSAAAFLRLSVRKTRELLADGRLASVRIGRRVLLEIEELRRFIDESRTERRR
jgi:excisionase family DNA binding protein